MSNKLPVKRVDHSAVLSKTKRLSQITQKILDNRSEIPREVVEEWIKALWEWADECDIPNGKLPREREKLLSLREANFFNLGLETLPEAFGSLEQLTSLVLWDNWFKTLPESIVNLRHLKKLNLRGNPLTLTASQNSWIKELRNNGCTVYIDNFTQNKAAKAETPGVSSKKPPVKREEAKESTVPAEKPDTTAIKAEDPSKEIAESFEHIPFFSHSQSNELVDDSWMERLWEWADENGIGDLEWVKNNFVDNGGYYQGLPREKSELLNLTELHLWHNQLTELPKEIVNLTNLTELSLKDNQFAELPKEIGDLTNLTHLDLGYNQFTELPKEISNLTNLTHLLIYNNQFTELPKEIWSLTNLTFLDLRENRLAELPKEIGDLTNLTRLFLFKNQLKELPKEISNLTNLTHLWIHNNQLTELPKEIWSLTNLTFLDLKYNQFTELPKEIGDLTNLTHLFLLKNQLKELPKEISNLTNLTHLSLGDNPDMILTKAQKEWIIALEKNGCSVQMDDGLLEKTKTLEIDINEDEIPF